MDCPQSNQYVERSRIHDGLELLENEVLDEIRSSFRCRVEYGASASEISDIRYAMSNQDPTSLLLKNLMTGGGRFIEGSARVYALSDAEWTANSKLTDNPGNIGRYLYTPAVILLHSDGNCPVSWCRNVLTHETLHSVSVYSRIWTSSPDITSKHNALIEGITECLTGYTLLKKHPDCYNVWKLNAKGKCGIAYRERTRLFCSLAQTLGIDPIANFYLSLERRFNIPWDQFLQTIHSLGFTKFNFSLNENIVFRESLFREACVKSIKDFKKIYNSQAKSLDFSLIP